MWSADWVGGIVVVVVVGGEVVVVGVVCWWWPVLLLALLLLLVGSFVFVSVVVEIVWCRGDPGMCWLSRGLDVVLCAD